MGCEFFLAAIENDLARPQALMGLALDGKHIARPDGRQHAEPGDLQARRTSTANQFFHQIAAGCVEVRLAMGG